MYFAARDAVGTRPLYYTIQNNQFYYSDDIGEVLSVSGMKKEPNVENMCRLMEHQAIPYDGTLYKHIKRLPPGHYMQVDKEMQIEIVRYWKPEEIKIDKYISASEAKGKFSMLFEQVITERIDSFSNTAFDLSGGLDSSSVVCMTKQMYPHEKLVTLSQSYRSLPQCDESEYIDTVLERYDVESIKADVDALDYKKEYSLAYNYALEPYWPILVTHTTAFHVAKILQERGIKRLITGQGADQLMGGTPYSFYDYFKYFQLRQLVKELRTAKRPFYAVKNFILLPALGEKNKKNLKKMLQWGQSKTSHHHVKCHTTEKDFHDMADFVSRKRLAFWHDIDALTNTTQSLFFDLSAYHVVNRHFGIKAFHPFFDRRLMELMLSLPSKYKFSQSMTKVLLRSAMKGILPEKIRLRKDKAEFTPVIKQQIDAIDLDALLGDTHLAKLGLIEQAEVDKLKEDYQSGKMKTVAHFWKIINMEYWYRYNFVMNQEEE